MDFKKCVMGLELGSTRIKAVLLNEKHEPVASGSFDWENRLVNGVWTYSMDEVHEGLRSAYRNLKADIFEKFGEVPTTFGAMGVSAMMHGYLPFGEDGKPLCEFRTWRNTMTAEAAAELSRDFGFNIPQRWSIAHLYQAILNREPHIGNISYLTTLAGYVHRMLTGEKKMGIGEASGMFPIDGETLNYDTRMVEIFDGKIEGIVPWKLLDILPDVVPAGVEAGRLTKEGALFLDPDGDLEPGLPLAPCEGDAGTGMAATNSVRVRTGNVSAGTSDFAMLVTDHPLGAHREIDMVTTPAGLPVAMVHCNNCTSDINAWVGLFGQVLELMGVKYDKGELFTRLFTESLKGEIDAGGLVSYNYFSGEGVTDLDEGRPVFLRKPDSIMSAANFMRCHIMSALATLKIGMDILTMNENLPVDKMYGHGGFFKTPGVGQRFLSAAIGAPVSVMKTAGEGGPYGMALLAAYMLHKEDGETLEDYLDHKVFADAESSTLMADDRDIEGFNRFLENYKGAFAVETSAIRTL